MHTLVVPTMCILGYLYRVHGTPHIYDWLGASDVTYMREYSVIRLPNEFNGVHSTRRQANDETFLFFLSDKIFLANHMSAIKPNFNNMKYAFYPKTFLENIQMFFRLHDFVI